MEDLLSTFIIVGSMWFIVYLILVPIILSDDDYTLSEFAPLHSLTWMVFYITLVIARIQFDWGYLWLKLLIIAIGTAAVIIHVLFLRYYYLKRQ